MRAQIDEKLKSFGLTPSGREFVVKALDPASVGPGPGIPDTSACSVLRPEYTVQFTIPPPSVSTANWDLMCVFPPGDTVACIYAFGPAGTDFSQSTPTGGGTGWVPLQPSIDVPSFFDITTLASGAPVGNAQRSVRSPASAAYTFRHMYKSVTAELVAAAVADQGDVYAAQYPLEMYEPSLLGLPVNSLSTGKPLMVQQNCVRIPFNEADLTLSARAPYVGRARDGVYMPLRLVGPQQEFAKLATAGVGFDNVASCTITKVTNSQNLGIPQVLNFIPDNAGDAFIGSVRGNMNFQYDTGYDNTSVGVIIWRGLAATSGGGGFGASVMLKIIDGQEICPRPTAADRVYLKPALKYEPLAMQAYYAIMSEMACAYPARYNALGALLPLLSSVASRLLPAIASGGRTFLREMLGEERAAERKPVNAPKRSTSILSRASSKPGLKTSRRKKTVKLVKS